MHINFNFEHCSAASCLLLITENMKINETSKMATPIEERVDQNLKIRTGMVMVSDGKSKPELMRLHLTMEMCTLQKQDLSTPTSSVSNTNNIINPPIESKVRQ